MGPTEIALSPTAGIPLLAAAQLLPLAAAGLALALHRARWLWLLGVVLGAAELALVLALYRAFDASLPQLQFVESLALGPLRYHAAVDGLSIAFMLLTALVTLLVLLYGVVLRQQPYARFLAAVFSLEATVMGMFTTLNLLWFVTLSAVELVLIAYLLGQWSTSPERELAIRRYQQFMGIGLLLLVAILGGVFLAKEERE